MLNNIVYYVVEVVDNIDKEPKIAFYDKNTADSFIKMKKLNFFDGRSGFKVEEGNEKKSVKALRSLDDYKKLEKIIEFQQQIKKLKAELEIEDESILQ